MHGFFVESETEKDGLHFVLFEPAVFIGLEHAAGLFVHGRVREVDVLLQVADGIVLRNIDGSAVDAFLTQDHLEKCRFSATVAAYEPYAFVACHQKAGTVKQHLLAKRFRDVLYLNHGM